VPYDELRVVIGQIHYGGHVADATDFKLLETVLSELMSPKLQETEGYPFSLNTGFFYLFIIIMNI